MAKMASGLAPANNRRITRETNSQVFPVPAEALTVALECGLMAASGLFIVVCS
jgi:hypothetical protein